jgi:hypothetical protein
MKVSLSMYSIFLLVKSTATLVHAVDIPAGTPDFNVCPEPRPPGPVVPVAKPGMRPLNEGAKGTFIGAASAICAAALQSGDFALGLACAFVLIIGGIVINRPPHE